MPIATALAPEAFVYWPIADAASPEAVVPEQRTGHPSAGAVAPARLAPIACTPKGPVHVNMCVRVPARASVPADRAAHKHAPASQPSVHAHALGGQPPWGCGETFFAHAHARDACVRPHVCGCGCRRAHTHAHVPARVNVCARVCV